MKNLEIKTLENTKYELKILTDFKRGKIDKRSEGDYEWLPTRQCFYCCEEKKVGSDYDIYELTTRFSDYESSSGRYYKIDKNELWIICSEFDCQTSIQNKSAFFHGRTPQGGNPVTRVLTTKLIDGIANRKLEKSAEQLAEEKIEREKEQEKREFEKNNWTKVNFVKIENEIWAKKVQNCENGVIASKIVAPEPKRKDKVELVTQFLAEMKIDEVLNKKEWDKL